MLLYTFLHACFLAPTLQILSAGPPSLLTILQFAIIFNLIHYPLQSISPSHTSCIMIVCATFVLSEYSLTLFNSANNSFYEFITCLIISRVISSITRIARDMTLSNLIISIFEIASLTPYAVLLIFPHTNPLWTWITGFAVDRIHPFVSSLLISRWCAPSFTYKNKDSRNIGVFITGALLLRFVHENTFSIENVAVGLGVCLIV